MPLERITIDVLQKVNLGIPPKHFVFGRIRAALRPAAGCAAGEHFQRSHALARTKLFWLKTAFAAAICCLLLPLAAQAEEEDLPQPRGVVARCFDGDTLKLTDRRVVRLAGIDSPEAGRDGKKCQYYARQSRDVLNSLAQGQKVRLLTAGLKSRDRHGRIIADVVLEDGQSLNDLMIKRGAAFFYPHQDLNPQLQERLRALQQEAIAERRGLWAHLLSLPLAMAAYTGNRDSLRFFPADCPDAQRIKPRNRVHFGLLMDAFLAGYAPARVCSFWPVQP